ncbi:MAG: serine hydrolase [Verrucomicrobiales bacterium]|nr:serine hydrolase [Verrucomicrobiales bacterium]
MKTGFVIFLCGCLGSGIGLSDEVSRILFGSCIKEAHPVPIFETIVKQEPDAFVFLGDNIYADTDDMAVMQGKYAKLAANPGFAELKKVCPIFATWDDHDYGVNDGGADYQKRDEAQKVFLDFWEEPADSSRRKSPGVYDSVVLGEGDRRVQLILLDTRYFRGPLKKGERRVGGPYYPEAEDAGVPMLGETQWKWLEAQLKVPAEVRIIASSIQFVSEAAGQETWANLPGEQKRMLQLIEKTGANGIFFISGDRHWADIAAFPDEGPYPIYDFTSSALNQIHKRGTPTDNRYRIVDNTFHLENYGQIDIDWEAPSVEIEVKICDLSGNSQISKVVSLDELKLSQNPLQAQADEIHRTRQQPSESVSLGRIKGDDAAFAFAGATHQGGPVPDQDTLYEIGSITKVFTAILLAEAVRTGKASLDDPVAKYLPVSAIGKNSPLDRITLKSLATHTSGLPRLPSDLFSKETDPKNPYAHYDEKHLYTYLKKLTDDGLESPGKHSYSNLGFGLLGHILELLWEKPCSELVEEQIFGPLGMEDSFILTKVADLPNSLAKKMATGHHGGKAVPHWELNVFAGAGAGISSANDLLKFARAHWSDETPPGLAESLKKVGEPQLEKQGLGWLLSGPRRVHNGGTGGFRSELSINVEKKTARVTLKNSAGESVESEVSGDFSAVTGFWEGVLDAGAQQLKLVMSVDRTGRILGFSIDQGGAVFEAAKTSFKDGRLTASFPSVGAYYHAGLKDGSLVGKWSQGGDLNLTMMPSETMPDSLLKGLSVKYPKSLNPLLGCWSGFIGGKSGLFVYIKVEKLGDSFLAQLYSPDQSPAPMPVSRLRLEGDDVVLEVAAVKGGFRGKFDRESKSLTGTWNQGRDIPLALSWSEAPPERPEK